MIRLVLRVSTHLLYVLDAIRRGLLRAGQRVERVMDAILAWKVDFLRRRMWE